MVNILKMLINRNYTKGVLINAEYIVWHYTANPSATALNHYNYFSKNDVGASAHFFVDKNGIIQTLEENWYGWHVGTKAGYKHPTCRNNNSIGVELCIEADGSIHPDTLKNAIDLGKYLMDKHPNIDINDNLRHHDVTGKLCPKPMVENYQMWVDFKNSLVEVPKPIEVPQVVPQPATDVYRVRLSWADVKSQKGAYGDLDNAKKCADANANYFVFNSKGEVVYPVKQAEPQAPVKPQNNSQYGVVNATSLNVRNGAGTGYKVIGSLKKNQKVKIGAKVNGWYNIYFGSHGGWVSADYIKLI